MQQASEKGDKIVGVGDDVAENSKIKFWYFSTWPMYHAYVDFYGTISKVVWVLRTLLSRQNMKNVGF